MNPRYSYVASRAKHRCEYCLAPESVFNFPFEVEHIVPPGRGGLDDLENLALACRSCNVFKSDVLEARDPLSQMIVKLFHPRTDRWEENFVVTESGLVTGLTAVGRVTIEQLRMNAPAQVAARATWLKLGIFG